MYIAELHQGPLEVAEVGGKAAALSYLLHHGVRVPPGFVLSTRAHREFLETFSFDLAKSDSDREMTDRVLPDAISAQVSQALARFPLSTRFAVRSSAMFEDLAEASFAGQYDTVLDVGHHQVLSAILHCWSSLANQHAHAYARKKGLAIDHGHMGVIVQALVPADTAGVSFSLNPVTGAEQVVINSAYGLGESVVSGIVTPDTYLIDKKTDQIQQILGEKECMVRPASEGGTKTLDTPEWMRSRFSLSADQVNAVYRLTLLLENLAGFPVDIEWAFEEQHLYCLQMRPIALKGVIRA